MKHVIAAALAALLLASAGNSCAQGESSGPAEPAPAAADDGALYARFERELKAALAAKNPVATALLVNFPLRVNIDGSQIEIANAAALQAYFGMVFTPGVRRSVAQASPGREEPGVRFMMGAGTLWMERIDHGNGPRFRVTIVNGTREESAAVGYPQLLYACETIKHRIVIEQTGDAAYRYRSWNLPGFPPAKPSLELAGTADYKGTGGCGYAVYAFERGDTRIDVAEPAGCGQSNWPQGWIAVTIKGEPAGDWACE